MLCCCSSATIADDLYGFCFDSHISLSQVKSYLRTIALPKDRIYLRESLHCIEVELSAARKTLFETYLWKKYRIVRQYSGVGSTPTQQERVMKHCRIKIIKTGKSKSKTNLYKIGENSTIRQTDKKGESKSVSQLVLGEGLPGELKVDEEDLKVICRSRGKDYYALEIYLKSKIKNSQISTAINARRGQKINLGNVVDQLKDKERTLSINEGIHYQKKRGTSNVNYDLIIE